MWWLFLGCTEPPRDPPPPDRPFDEWVVAVAHNAMASDAAGYLFPNQHLDFEDQLALGVRGFMLDVHDDGGTPALCHSSCSLGSRPLVDGFAVFVEWLDEHPDKVVILVVQDEIPPDGIVAAAFDAGLDRLAMAPFDGPPPTLGALVGRGEQLLFSTERAHDDVPPWYQHAYGDLVVDNDYAAKTVDDFGCGPFRGAPDNPFYLLNHFLTAPVASAELAADANTDAALRAHLARCEAATGRAASWIAVDFVDVGDTLAVVDALNDERSPR